MLLCWQFYGSLAGGSVLYVIPQIFALTLGLLWMLAFGGFAVVYGALLLRLPAARRG